MQAQMWAVSGLAVELGMDRRTLSRILEDIEPDETETQGSRTIRRYRMAKVVKHMLGMGDGDLDLNAEKARLTKEQADKIERENMVARGKLVVIEAVEQWVETQYHEVKAKQLGLARSMAPVLAPITDPIRVEEILEGAIHESLRALSDVDAAAISGEGAEGAEAAAEADGEPVGGPPPKTEPGD